MLSISGMPWMETLMTHLGLKKQPAPKDEALYTLLEETKKELDTHRRNLMFADSPALTDMYIYAMKATEIRYAHLLRLIRSEEVAS